MATFYDVTNRVMTSKTTAAAVEAAGLRKACEIIIAGRHAVKFTAGGPDAPTEAVAVYEAPGDDFTGQRV